MKDLKQFIKTTLQEFLNENKTVVYSDDNDPFNNDELHTFGEKGYGNFTLKNIPVQKINHVISDRATIKGFEFDNYDGYHDEILDYIQNNINNIEPIIVLDNYDGTYELVDGMHRVTIFNENNIPFIQAWVGDRNKSLKFFF